MHHSDRATALKEARQSLERMQTFDTDQLPRVAELGTAINFQSAVEPANLLIDLYRQLPIEVLENIPTPNLKQIRDQANVDFSHFKAVLEFQSGNPVNERDARVNNIGSAYDNAFGVLYPFISYSVRKSTDFGKLEREARAKVQTVVDLVTEVEKQLASSRGQAESMLSAMRKAAAEQGVSQEAIHFKIEADNHESQAGTWLTATIGLTIALGIYAIATFFIHMVVSGANDHL